MTGTQVVLKAMARTGSVYITSTALARELEWTENDTIEVLGNLDDSGLVIADGSDGVLIVTLTPEGARYMGLKAELVAGHLTWVPDQPREDGVAVIPAPWEGSPMAFERIVEAKKDWAGPLRYDRLGIPMPTTLICGFLWDAISRPICPTCKGLPLSDQSYCIRCDRSAFDADIEAMQQEFAHVA